MNTGTFDKAMEKKILSLQATDQINLYVDGRSFVILDKKFWEHVRSLSAWSEVKPVDLGFELVD